MEGRVSRLEGAYEQVGERLNSLDGCIGSVEARLNSVEANLQALRGEIAQNFRWLIGAIGGSGLTVVLTILFHKT